MPTYEYACTSCGHHLEVSQSFSDEPLTDCPSCSGSVRKVFGSIGIVLKGSGFYRTDSRSPSSASRRSTSTAESTGEAAGGSASDGTSSNGSGSGSSTESSSSSTPSGATAGSAASAS